jgi:transcriptional repressor NrdR
MRCTFCAHADTRVVDSRLAEDGTQIRRRRECPNCSARFSTVETVEIKPAMIVKKDGRRESFSESKLRGGIERAFEKRKARKVRTAGEREVASTQLGAWVMQELKPLDQVAYVRFASVYRRFEDVQAFREEIEQLERDLPAELLDRQLRLLQE